MFFSFFHVGYSGAVTYKQTFMKNIQSVLDRLIFPEKTCTVKSRTTQDNIHLLHAIIVNDKATLSSLDQL